LDECFFWEKKDTQYFINIVPLYHILLSHTTQKKEREKVQMFKMVEEEKSQKAYPTTAEVRTLKNLSRSLIAY